MTETTALDALRAQITTDWTVDITDHEYLSDSREGASVDAVTANGLLLRPARAWSSQGRRLPTMAFRWDGDREVNGHVVRLYHTPAPHTGKPRRIVKTFWFHPPRAY